MRIVKLGPNSVTIELETPDCIGVVSGLYQGFDKTAEPLYSVLASAFLMAAYAAWLLAADDDPKTVEHMWEMWGPIDSMRSKRRPVPYRGKLPKADTYLVDGRVLRTSRTEQE